MPSRFTKFTFGEIHQLLGGLGFVQVPAKKPGVIFERDADTFFIFRPHRPSDPVDAMTVSVVRKFLDEKGLLERDDFEDALHQASANGVAKGKTE